MGCAGRPPHRCGAPRVAPRRGTARQLGYYVSSITLQAAGKSEFRRHAQNIRTRVMERGLCRPLRTSGPDGSLGQSARFRRPGPDRFRSCPHGLARGAGRQVKRVVLGNGFCCPPDCSPLPDLRPWMPAECGWLQKAEQHVLESMNRVLESRRAEPLGRVTQLYGEVDETLLTTLAEFDHYPDRKTLTLASLTPGPSPVLPSTAGGRGEQVVTPGRSPKGRGEIEYRGPWSLSGGEPPVWPAGGGKRIYAYLARFPACPRFCTHCGAPALQRSSLAVAMRSCGINLPRRAFVLRLGDWTSKKLPRSAIWRCSAAAKPRRWPSFWPESPSCKRRSFWNKPSTPWPPSDLGRA